MTQLDLSIIIITYNEEHALPRCLRSLATLAAEVIVVDSHSSDRTCALARDYGARVSVSAFVDYADQKNKALRQATRSWVLNVDADEELNAELAHWLRENFAKPAFPPQLAGFRIECQLVFMGRRLRFGKTSDHCLRLFRREQAYFRGAVHERVVVTGTVVKLKHGAFYHHSYRDHHDYYTKFNRYTSMFAQQHRRQPRRLPTLFVLHPLTRFCYLYVIRGGFLDGYPGYCMALFSALYSFVKYAKLKELYASTDALLSETPRVDPDCRPSIQKTK